MFRQLGTFALLAVCLFAIAIVMGSCGPPKTRCHPQIGTAEAELADKIAGTYTAIVAFSDKRLFGDSPGFDGYLHFEGRLGLLTNGDFILQWHTGLLGSTDECLISYRMGRWMTRHQDTYSTYLILNNVRYKYHFKRVGNPKVGAQKVLHIFKMTVLGQQLTVEWKEQ